MVCTEILEAVAKAANIKKIGVLSENDFISILPAGGKTKTKYRDGTQMAELNVQIQCRGNDQKELILSLQDAAKAICAADFSTAENYAITGIDTGTYPIPTLADESGNFIYSCGINITYYDKSNRR